MGKATVIPFGPQHPVLPEPLHLDLVVEDETVLEAIPQIGFIHRGLEKLVETRDLNQFIYVAERICGICAFGHSMGYAETVEKLMGVEVPRRAEYLRVIWHELLPHPFPRAVDGPGRRRVRLREPVHALLAPARARAGHLREDHRRPRHLLGREGGRRGARHRRRPDGRDQAHAGRHQGRLPADLRRVPEGLVREEPHGGRGLHQPRGRARPEHGGPVRPRLQRELRRAHAGQRRLRRAFRLPARAGLPGRLLRPRQGARAGGAADPSPSSRR